MELEKLYGDWKETEKRPHLAQCQRIDNEWRNQLKVSGDLKKEAKQIQAPFLTRKQAKIDDEIAKQRQAQYAARDAAQAGEAPVLPEPKNETRAKGGAAVTRQQSLRTVYEFSIVDARAAAEFIAQRNMVPEIFLEAIKTVARQFHVDNIKIPGIKIEVTQKVV